MWMQAGEVVDVTWGLNGTITDLTTTPMEGAFSATLPVVPASVFPSANYAGGSGTASQGSADLTTIDNLGNVIVHSTPSDTTFTANVVLPISSTGGTHFSSWMTFKYPLT